MTENEAIKEIRHESCNEKGVSKRCHDRCMYGKEKCAYSMAIEALEEVMKYRELGTIEELKDLKDGKLSGRELAMIAVDVNKLKKYRTIGTVEECREAMERQDFAEDDISQIRFALDYLHNADLSNYGEESIKALESVMRKLNMDFIDWSE